MGVEEFGPGAERAPQVNKVGKARSDHPETSKKAALHVYPRSGTQRERVLLFVLAHGDATDEEIQDGLRMRGDTERPRRGELVEGGWLVDSHGERGTTSGEHAIVWKPTPKAKLPRRDT